MAWRGVAWRGVKEGWADRHVPVLVGCRNDYWICRISDRPSGAAAGGPAGCGSGVMDGPPALGLLLLCCGCCCGRQVPRPAAFLLCCCSAVAGGDNSRQMISGRARGVPSPAPNESTRGCTNRTDVAPPPPRRDVSRSCTVYIGCMRARATELQLAPALRLFFSFFLLRRPVLSVFFFFFLLDY